MAIGLVADVEAEILDAVVDLIPIGQRLLIDRADSGETLFLEIGTSEPPMNPPPPVMTIKSFFFVSAIESTLETVWHFQ